jgi:predicted 2-oxoglutarate/Fe(II)-dependent dioxygenase YbiX
MGLPEAARAVLERAAARALPTVRTMLPSVRTMGYWTFVSYGEGQFITPHIDLSDNDPDPAHPKVAGLSLCLTDPDRYGGGEFFVETACDDKQWRVPADGRMPTVRPDCDESSEWYRRQVRSRWRVRPGRGDGLLYGSQMTHGTEPVGWGRVSKIIGFLIS